MKKVCYIIPRCNTGSDRYYELLNKNIHNTKLIYLPRYCKIFPPLILFWKRFSTDFQDAEIIHTNLDFVYFLQSSGKKIIGTLHHDIFDKNYFKELSLWKKIYHSFFSKIYFYLWKKSAYRIILVDENYTLSQKEEFKDKYIHIQNGIDLGEIRKYKSVKKEKKCKKILFIGKKNKRKWWDVVLDIVNSGLLPQNYVIYCTNPDRSAKKKQIQKNLKDLWYLSREKLIRNMWESDLLFCPSRIEWFSYTIAESLACKCPVLSRKDWAWFSTKTWLFHSMIDIDNSSKTIKKMIDIITNKKWNTYKHQNNILRCCHEYKKIYQ